MFLAVLLVMLLGAINYNNNLAFMLVFLLGGIALVGLLHTYRNLHGLALLSAAVEPVFAGDVAVFTFLLRPGGRQRTALGFFFEKKRLVLKNMAGDVDARVEVGTRTVRRGIFQPPALTVFSRFPLGLFQAWVVVHLPSTCLVYARPLAGDFRFSGDQQSEEGESPINQAGPDDFQGLKPYQPGHKVQHIAWKALSRGQGVYVKDFTATGGGSVMLDFERIRTADSEKKLSRLCHMVLKASDMNLQYGLKLPGETVIPARGEAHKRKCLRSLALYGLSDFY